MSNSVSVRGYRKGDEEAVNALYNLAFSARRTLDEWRWKFEGHAAAAGLEDVPLTIAESGGRIVGQYAALVVRFKFQDRILLAAEPVETAIDPQFRGGASALLRLWAAQPALAAERQVAFGYGFPNEPHYAVGERMLHYLDLFPLPVLYRRVNWRHTLRRRLPWLPTRVVRAAGEVVRAGASLRLARAAVRGVAIREVSSFDAGADEFWERVQQRYGILAVRDRRYLNWRYAAAPARRYTALAAEVDGRLDGYVVLATRQEGRDCVGLVMDLLAEDEGRVAGALIRGALRWFLARGVDYTLCGMLRDDPMHRALRRLGFREHPAFPSVPAVYMLFSREVDEAILTDQRHWHLTFGDADI